MRSSSERFTPSHSVAMMLKHTVSRTVPLGRFWWERFSLS